MNKNGGKSKPWRVQKLQVHAVESPVHAFEGFCFFFLRQSETLKLLMCCKKIFHKKSHSYPQRARIFGRQETQKKCKDLKSKNVQPLFRYHTGELRLVEQSSSRGEIAVNTPCFDPPVTPSHLSLYLFTHNWYAVTLWQDHRHRSSRWSSCMWKRQMMTNSRVQPLQPIKCSGLHCRCRNSDFDGQCHKNARKYARGSEQHAQKLTLRLQKSATRNSWKETSHGTENTFSLSQLLAFCSVLADFFSGKRHLLDFPFLSSLSGKKNFALPNGAWLFYVGDKPQTAKFDRLKWSQGVRNWDRSAHASFCIATHGYFLNYSRKVKSNWIFSKQAAPISWPFLASTTQEERI